MAKLPDAIDLEISELAGIWRDTTNPLAAWRCFVIARQNSRVVPAVIDAEIFRFAETVIAPAGGSVTQKTVAEAWGIATGRKPVMELRNTQRDIAIYLDFWEMRRDGKTRAEAIAALILAHNKTDKTIEGVLNRFSEMHGPGDPFDNPAFRES